MTPLLILRRICVPASALALLLVCAPPPAHAIEHITLSNGFTLECVRREPQGDKVRIFLTPSASGAEPSYLDVASSSIVSIDLAPDPPAPSLRPSETLPATPSHPARQALTRPELTELLAHAGSQHHIDAELLASVVHAESAGNPLAVSRTGARGLMQLMPATAASLHVQNSFAANENVEGGSAYLDSLLTRYHDNIALALAAYNAGPGAVDRFHGIPPFRETRAYVSRVIREFNQRKLTLLTQTSPAASSPSLSQAH